MRVGVITTSFPRFERDIAGTFVLGLARALVARGHRVDVVAPEPAKRMPRPELGAGVEVHWTPYLRPQCLQQTFYGAGVPDNLRRDARAWLGVAPATASLALRARALVHRWDAVMSHWATPSALVAGMVRGGRPHLAVLHSADVHALGALPRWFPGRIARSATDLWFVSKHHRDRFLALLSPELREETATRVHVGPMGIDPLPSERPTREGARAALGLGRFTVASIGRLVKIKGLDQAIEALEGLDEVELLVAGAGPERAHLVELARRHDTRVRFLGPVFGADKETLLAAADAVLVPSRPTSTGRTEGVPTAAIEALARGIPVIATDTGGLPELLAHGGGLIVPADAESLRRAVERLRSDAALHARIAGEATRVGSAYTWDRVVPRFEATLTGACR